MCPTLNSGFVLAGLGPKRAFLEWSVHTDLGLHGTRCLAVTPTPQDPVEMPVWNYRAQKPCHMWYGC